MADRKTFKDAFIHFFLADVLFAAFLGGCLGFIVLVLFRNQALFAFEGIGGMALEAVVTWCSVMISSKMMRRTRTTDSIALAIISTGFSLLVALIAMPYLQFFSDISHAPRLYLLLKEALHMCVFYSSTIIYFSGLSMHSLFHEPTSHTA